MDPQIPQKLELEFLQKKLPQLQKLNSWTGKPLTNESNGVFLNPTEVERNLNQYGNKLKSLPHQNNNVQQFEHSKPVVLPKVGLPPLRAKPAILPSLPSAELLHRKALPTPSVGEQDRYNITPARMYRKNRLKHLPAKTNKQLFKETSKQIQEMKEDVRKLDKIVEATKTKQQLALDEKIKSRQKQWEAEKCEKRQREVLQNSAVILTKCKRSSFGALQSFTRPNSVGPGLLKGNETVLLTEREKVEANKEKLKKKRRRLAKIAAIFIIVTGLAVLLALLIHKENRSDEDQSSENNTISLVGALGERKGNFSQERADLEISSKGLYHNVRQDTATDPLSNDRPILETTKNAVTGPPNNDRSLLETTKSAVTDPPNIDRSILETTKSAVNYPPSNDRSLLETTKSAVTYPSHNVASVIEVTKSIVAGPPNNVRSLLEATKSAVTDPPNNDRSLRETTKSVVTESPSNDGSLLEITKSAVTDPLTNYRSLLEISKSVVTKSLSNYRSILETTKCAVTDSLSNYRSFLESTKSAVNNPPTNYRSLLETTKSAVTDPLSDDRPILETTKSAVTNPDSNDGSIKGSTKSAVVDPTSDYRPIKTNTVSAVTDPPIVRVFILGTPEGVVTDVTVTTGTTPTITKSAVTNLTVKDGPLPTATKNIKTETLTNNRFVQSTINVVVTGKPSTKNVINNRGTTAETLGMKTVRKDSLKHSLTTDTELSISRTFINPTSRGQPTREEKSLYGSTLNQTSPRTTAHDSRRPFHSDVLKAIGKINAVFEALKGKEYAERNKIEISELTKEIDTIMLQSYDQIKETPLVPQQLTKLTMIRQWIVTRTMSGPLSRTLTIFWNATTKLEKFLEEHILGHFANKKTSIGSTATNVVTDTSPTGKINPLTIRPTAVNTTGRTYKGVSITRKRNQGNILSTSGTEYISLLTTRQTTMETVLGTSSSSTLKPLTSPDSVIDNSNLRDKTTNTSGPMHSEILKIVAKIRVIFATLKRGQNIEIYQREIKDMATRFEQVLNQGGRTYTTPLLGADSFTELNSVQHWIFSQSSSYKLSHTVKLLTKVVHDLINFLNTRMIFQATEMSIAVTTTKTKATHGVLTLPDLRFLCSRDHGYYPYPNDCSKFIQCAHGLANIMHCGPGTVFNPNLNVCDWPKNVKCPKS